MITRRTALAAALAAGAAAALPGTAAAARAATGAPAQAPEGLDVPMTLAAEGEAGTVQEPGFALGHVGAVWAGPAVGATVRFRTADGWSAWQPLPRGCSPAADRGRHGALVPGGRALAFQVEPPADATGATVVALNTTDGPVVGRAAPARDGLDVGAVPSAPSAGAPGRLGRGFRYYSRAGWGADESLRFRPDGTEAFPAAHFPVQTLTVHHTADGSDDTDYPARVRAIYRFLAVDQDFGDMGYHLLIDPDGALYEGRASGPDPFPVFGDRRPGVGPLATNGAHVGGFNAGNVGVALLGDFTGAPPTPAARRTLTRVLAVLAGVTGLDPLGTVAYDNPLSTATATVDAISGHRDWAATECPGDAFHPDLPALRRDVAALLGSRRRAG